MENKEINHNSIYFVIDKKEKDNKDIDYYIKKVEEKLSYRFSVGIGEFSKVIRNSIARKY